MKGEPISSGYLSDHETKLQDMVQQLSVESQDSRFCYLTSSEVSFTIGNLIIPLLTSLKKDTLKLRTFEFSFVTQANLNLKVVLTFLCNLWEFHFNLVPTL